MIVDVKSDLKWSICFQLTIFVSLLQISPCGSPNGCVTRSVSPSQHTGLASTGTGAITHSSTLSSTQHIISNSIPGPESCVWNSRWLLNRNGNKSFKENKFVTCLIYERHWKNNFVIIQFPSSLFSGPPNRLMIPESVNVTERLTLSRQVYHLGDVLVVPT